MSAIGCNEFLNQLDVWMEDGLHPNAQAHMRDCPACRGVVEDLAAISRMAPALAVADPEEPPERVWMALRGQLEREGLIRHPYHVLPSTLARWLEEISAAVSRPALAGAYLAVLITVAFALGRPINPRINAENWMRKTQSATLPLSAQLNHAERNAISVASSSRSLVTASLHKNLDIVDNYISLCEKSVREDPENEIARDYLYEAYQQKADLLAQMSDRGVDGQ